jgi:hypothetical protein
MKKLKEIELYDNSSQKKPLEKSITDLNDQLEHVFNIYSKEKLGVLPFSYVNPKQFIEVNGPKGKV